jgi:hypothetical protein
MNSKPLVLGLLVVGCVTAAAGGAYVAVRQNGADRVTAQPPSARTSASVTKPVAETEAVVAAPTASTAAATSGVEAEKAAPNVEAPTRPSSPASTSAAPTTVKSDPRRPAATRTPAPIATRETARPNPVTASDPAVERPTPGREPITAGVSTSSAPAPAEAVPTEPPPPPRPQIVEVVIPASSVLGLQVENSISSETARVEDRVEARVTRDVRADGQVAIPAGTKVIGNVIVVERGGKLKDRARLGVRFHTVVLASGDQLPLRSDAIYREGEAPGNDSSRKIGGAAIGGAILGAIIGGGKGAAIGAAAGGGAGTAVVMAGDRSAATLAAGTIVNVRLSSPVSVDVEKEQ